MSTCGTGTGNFPQPGDPDLNSSILSAQAAYGGIRVSWSYPELNAEAVHRTILYRGVSSNFDVASEHKKVFGDAYFDNIDENSGTTYYYWIQNISVHGTVGELIGPASATMSPTTAQLMEKISGQISETELSSWLTAKISDISGLNSDLLVETQARIDNDSLIGQALNTTNDNVGAVDTLIMNEITERVDGQNAMVSEIDVIRVRNKENEVMILDEQEARVTADGALANQINALQATGATIFRQEEAPTTGMVEGDLWIDVDDNHVMYQYLSGFWQVSTPNNLAGVFAALETEQTVRIEGDNALATDINRLESTVSLRARVLFQPVAPTSAELPAGESLRAGDIWIDTDAGNAFYRWSGSTWEADLIGVTVFRQDAEPVATDIGDLWFQQNYFDKAHQWDGENWVEVDLYTSHKVNAAIEDNNVTMVGYCKVGGVVTSEHQTPAECLAAGGEWQAAEPLAEAVKTVQIDDGDGETASVQQKMTSYRTELGDLNAQWGIKTDVNDLVGGIGLYNDGTKVTFMADVDALALGRLDQYGTPHLTYPFILDQGIVYIDKARIRSGDIDNAKIGNFIQSNDFIAGSQGWRLDKDTGIQAQAITIYSADGGVAFSSGGGFSWDHVAGVGRPEDNADVTSKHSNSIDNPSFEAGNTGWGANDAEIVNDATNSRSGNYCGRFQPADGYGALVNEKELTISEGDRVIAQGYGKITSGPGSLGMAINWLDGSRVNVGTSYSATGAATASTYKQLRVVGDAPANAVYAQFRFYLTASDATTVAYADDAYMAIVPRNSDIDALGTLNGPAQAGADVTADNVAAAITNQGLMATKDFPELFRWKGNENWPTGTNLAGARTWGFDSDLTGDCVVEVFAKDAEGGVHVALNGTELGTMSDVNLAETWFAFGGEDLLVDGYNELAIWASIEDGGQILAIQVQHAPAGTKLSGLVDSLNTINGPAEPGAETTTGKSLSVLVDRIASNIDESNDRKWAGESGADVTLNAQFAPSYAWGFNGSLDGWGGPATNIATPYYLSHEAINNDPQLIINGLQINGAGNTKVRMRMRRSVGTSWDGTLYYANSSHSWSGSFRKVIPDTTNGTEWVVLEWDMANLTFGGTDWVDNTITGLRFDLHDVTGDRVHIDWIAVGDVRVFASASAMQYADGKFVEELEPAEGGSNKTDLNQAALGGSSLIKNGDMTMVGVDGRPAGVKAAYGTATPGVVSYADSEKTILKIASTSDNSIGACFPAIRVKPGNKYGIFIRIKASAAKPSGLYFRVEELDSELPSGFTHLCRSAGEDGVYINNDRYQTFRNNAAIGTTWEEYYYEYTPTASAKWASPYFLNWTGMGKSELHIDVCHVFPLSDVTSESAGDIIFDQTSAPSNPKVGWIWIDNNDDTHRWNGSTWKKTSALNALRLTNGPAQAGADVTSDNTAAAIAGQGALATQSDVDWFNQLANKPTESLLRNNLIDPSTWVVGGTGSQGSFGKNGDTNENEIQLDEGPFGYSEPLWVCKPTGGDNGDGGWNIAISESDGFHHSKTYRSVVWIKTTDNNGQTYHGCDDTNTVGGGFDSNPYYWSGDLPQNNKWYLSVGIIHGSSYTGGDSGIAGIYDPETGKKVLNHQEYKNTTSKTRQIQRVYHYYNTTTTTRQYMARPRFEEVNGNEVPIDVLMARARYADGTVMEDLRPAEAGADTTAGKSLSVLINRTADQIAESAGKKWAAESGANITEDHKALSILTPDTRHENKAPSYYRALGTGIYPEFKKTLTMGIGSGTYGFLVTQVKWSADLGGGRVTQEFYDDNDVKFRRRGNSTDTGWEAWKKSFDENAKPDLGSDILNAIADNIGETSSKKWAGETGANVTEGRTSNDTSNVNGVGSGYVGGIRKQQSPTSGTAYYRIFSFGGNSGRGSGRLVLSYTGGGGGSPGTAVFEVSCDWGNTATINLLSRSKSMSGALNRVRVVVDSASGNSYIDLHLLANTAQISALFQGDAAGQAGGTGAVASGVNPSVSGLPTAIIDFSERPGATVGHAISSQRGVNDYIVNDNGDLYIKNVKVVDDTNQAGADKTADNPQHPNWLSALVVGSHNKIDVNNIDTFMASAAIGTAHIGELNVSKLEGDVNSTIDAPTVSGLYLPNQSAEAYREAVTLNIPGQYRPRIPLLFSKAIHSVSSSGSYLTKYKVLTRNSGGGSYTTLGAPDFFSVAHFRWETVSSSSGSQSDPTGFNSVNAGDEIGWYSGGWHYGRVNYANYTITPVSGGNYLHRWLIDFDWVISRGGFSTSVGSSHRVRSGNDRLYQDVVSEGQSVFELTANDETEVNSYVLSLPRTAAAQTYVMAVMGEGTLENLEFTALLVR